VPALFHSELHFNLTEATFYGALTISLAGFIAVLCNGAIADWAAQRVRMGRFMCCPVDSCSHWASAVGLMTTVGFAGAGLSPLLIGAFGEIVGLSAAFSLIALLYIAAVLLLLVSRRIVGDDMDDTERIVAEMDGLEEQMA
jgi:MFS family permease